MAAYLFNVCMNCTRDGQHAEDELVGNKMARLVIMLRERKENGEIGQLAES
jgi:hypothetical protein